MKRIMLVASSVAVLAAMTACHTNAEQERKAMNEEGSRQCGVSCWGEREVGLGSRLGSDCMGITSDGSQQEEG